MFKQLAVGAALLAAACSGNPAPASLGDDKVNVGYGTQDRSELGGAVNSIKREDIKNRSSQTIEDLIRSHVPGATIVHSRDGFSIRLRGPSSIYGSNDALIVLDGMPLADGTSASALAAIRPDEVAQIDVLKDGMAAIYGVRGANGVVVIQTRR